MEGSLAVVQISIHSLREEGDLDRAGIEHSKSISIHSLREEGDIILPP